MIGAEHLKRRWAGDRAVDLFIVDDSAPAYKLRRTTQGTRQVNHNIFELKAALRRGTSNTHATDNVAETLDNLYVLGFGGGPMDDFCDNCPLPVRSRNKSNEQLDIRIQRFAAAARLGGSNLKIGHTHLDAAPRLGTGDLVPVRHQRRPVTRAMFRQARSITRSTG